MKFYHLTKYIYYILITLMVIALGVTVNFLYNNFYQTLAQAQTVHILSSQIGIETINVVLWDEITQTLKDKKNPQITQGIIISDPFAPLDEVFEE